MSTTTYSEERPTTETETESESKFETLTISDGFATTFDTPSGHYRLTTEDRRGVEKEWFVSQDYELVNRKSHGSQWDCGVAWRNMEFPAHNMSYRDGSARIESGSNYHGIQYPDGSGEVFHYSTYAGVRTRTGLVIENDEDWFRSMWGGGVTGIPRNHMRLPLTSMHDLMRRSENATSSELRGITHVMGSLSGSKYPFMAYHEDGFALVMFTDPTANGRGLCGMVLSPEEAEALPTVDAALELLKPEAVREMEREGFTVSDDTPNEWAFNRFHGKTWRRYGSPGTVFRQGEWFFIPRTDEYVEEHATSPLFKVLNRGVVVETLPGITYKRGPVTECGVCGNDSFVPDVLSMTGIENAPAMRCPVCDELYVSKPTLRASFSNPMENHVPRDLLMSDDNRLFVRGTVRHNAGDHGVYNFQETWHEAVTHDRDVLTFPSTYAESTGRGGWD